MNLQEYILSGIIESYVLGLSSKEERIEFEKMCVVHPEVLEARNAFETSLENFAIVNGVAPAPALKNKILAAVSELNQTSGGKLVNMKRDEKSSRNFGWLKYAAAASIILLIGSLYFNYDFYNRNQQLQNNYADVQQKLNNSNEQLARMEKDADILQQNPNIKMAALHGTDNSPLSFVTVYWDTTSKDVYLMVNNLPTPPTDKQYQLWALLDGQPIDMGMLEMDNVSVNRKGLLLQMKNAQNAQAFAITLEKKGGSPSPSMDKMYAMGKL